MKEARGKKQEARSKTEKGTKTVKEERSKKTKLKKGVLSVVFTVVFISAVVVLNVIVGILSDRFNTSADLTAESIYSLDENTKKFLNDSLKSDVTITVLNSEKKYEEQDSAYKQVSEILKRMEKLSGHVEVNYLDIEQNPNYTARFKGETVDDNYIVVECEKTGRHKIISPYEYFSFNQTYLQYYGYYIIEGSNIEQETVSAMMYATSDKVVRVAFTEGYNESASGVGLTELLSRNGYEVEALPLTTTAEIDPEIDFVVVYAPELDMDKEQIAKLDKFLDNNGKCVIYFASVTQPRTPNIDEFLADWGLAVGYEIIGQTDERYMFRSNTLYAHFQQICDTAYTEGVYGTRLYTYGMYQRPVYKLENSDTNITVLMKTYDGAFAYPLDAEEAEDFDSSETGEFNVVATAQKTTEDAVSRVCVVGSDALASTLLMSYSNSNNAEFFVGMWNYISGRERGMTVKAKTLTPATFEMNVKTANTLAVILCIVIPVSVIVVGIVVWVRRRNR